MPSRSSLAAALALAMACTAIFPQPVEGDVPAHHGRGLARKKGSDVARMGPEAPLLATLVQTHTDERVLLDATSPSEARFDGMLADRVTGSTHALDPRLLDLLRALAVSLGAGPERPRIELVSGFRSPKLNEMLRKKGHHVASHSQHSLGHAVDFRVVLDGGTGPEDAMDPRDVEKAIRALGWTGGVGTYLTKDDRFVHADVGPQRSWRE